MLDDSIRKLRMRKDDPTREGLYASRWGIIKALSRQMDKKSGDPTWQIRRDSLSELTEQIISTYETGANSDRSHWVSQLAQDSASYVSDLRNAQSKRASEEINLQKSTEEMVQKAFTHLRTYAFEFNNAVGLSELHVTCTKPDTVTEVTRYSVRREPIETVSNYRARISTRFFSLVVRGNEGTVEFYLIPVQKVIGMSRTEIAYRPIARLMGSLNGSQPSWMIGDQELDSERLETLLSDLFKELIEHSRQFITRGR